MVHKGGGGVKKGRNLVHVVCEWPHSEKLLGLFGQQTTKTSGQAPQKITIAIHFTQ